MFEACLKNLKVPYWMQLIHSFLQLRAGFFESGAMPTLASNHETQPALVLEYISFTRSQPTFQGVFIPIILKSHSRPRNPTK